MKRRQFFLIGGTLAMLIWLAFHAWAGLPDGRLHLWFLDVGQGDAILARLPAGEWLLIDGGPDATVLEHLGRLMPFYERDLELVIVTHPHADHINGLVDVLERYRVRNLLYTGVKYNYVGYGRMLELAREEGTSVLLTEDSRDFRIGDVGLDLLYPGDDWRGLSIDNVNNSSIVFRLVYGGWKGFLSGDLEMEKEAELVERLASPVAEMAGGRGVPPSPPGVSAAGASRSDASSAAATLNLSADLLKAGHHGSKTSNSLSFVAAIDPETAVISCGAGNQFGHPAASTLETFRSAGVQVHRTDIEGTVEFEI